MIEEQVTGTGPGQLGRMQELASRLWSWSSRWHPGELTWFWWEGGGPASESRAATWQRDGTTVAWAWVKVPGRLDLQLDPAHPDLLEPVLAWFRETVGDRPRVITVVDGETHLIDALAARGWVLDRSGAFFAHLRLDLADLPAQRSLLPGMTLRSVRGEQDAELRAALHRAAFSPQGGDEPSADGYRRLMQDDQYRSELDWVVEAPDASPAAFCLSWIDDAHPVAVLEPVGTDPRHRRRGLARAAIIASLGVAADLGARHARVCARGDGGDAAAITAYESIGFRSYARNVRLVSPQGRRS